MPANGRWDLIRRLKVNRSCHKRLDSVLVIHDNTRIAYPMSISDLFCEGYLLQVPYSHPSYGAGRITRFGIAAPKNSTSP